MTDEPDLTERQEQVLRAFMAEKLVADIDPAEAGGLANDELARPSGRNGAMVSENPPTPPRGSEQFARAAEADEEDGATPMNYPSPAADPNFGRKIPPPLNPAVPSMIRQLKHAYDEIRSEILEFNRKTAELARGGKLDHGEYAGLRVHSRQLSDAVHEAQKAARAWNGNNFDVYEHTEQVHFIADHAKYVYAVATRDIAALQHKTADLAYIGKLERQACHDLQWLHCVPMEKKVYHGTLCVVRDEDECESGWDWGGNTYHDGRQVMIQARAKDWEILEHLWPSNELIAGDGAINEHPRGSVCQIAPVIDPYHGDDLVYEPILIDLDELIAQRDLMKSLEKAERNR